MTHKCQWFVVFVILNRMLMCRKNKLFSSFILKIAKNEMFTKLRYVLFYELFILVCITIYYEIITIFQ